MVGEGGWRRMKEEERSWGNYICILFQKQTASAFEASLQHR